MMVICGVMHPASCDYEEFNRYVIDNIRKMQSNGQDVEIQYQTATLPNGVVAYSALMIGRIYKEEPDENMLTMRREGEK